MSEHLIISKTVAIAAVPGETYEEKREYVAQLKEESETDSLVDDIKVGQDLTESLRMARKIGCSLERRNGRWIVLHPLASNLFAIDAKSRYTCHALAKWLKKIVRLQERKYAPMPVIAPKESAELAAIAAAEVAPVDPSTLLSKALSRLTLWTIYLPQAMDSLPHFMVRGFDLVDQALVARAGFTHHPSLIAARNEGVPAGLHRIARTEQDDPVILETWI